MNTEIKIPATTEKGTLYVPADDVRHRLLMYLPTIALSRHFTPLLNLIKVFDEKYTPSLRPVCGLHDPHGAAPTKLLHKHEIFCEEEVTRRDESAWQRRQRNGHWPTVLTLIHLLGISLYVIKQEVLPRDIEVVRVVVDQLVIGQPSPLLRVENNLHCKSAVPEEVSFIILGARPSLSTLESVR